MVVKKSTFIYNKTLKLTFIEDTHEYYINDTKRVYSPSAILSRIAQPYLALWGADRACKYIKDNLIDGASYSKQDILEMLPEAKKSYQSESKVATDYGSDVHHWLEMYIKNKPREPFKEGSAKRKTVDNILQWASEYNVKFLEAEKLLYSKEDNLAGMTDCVLEIEGKTLIGDFKTSRQISESYYLQLAFYAKAYEEMFPESKIEGTCIILSTKTGEFEIETRLNWREDYLTFKKLLEVTRWLDSNKKH